MIEKYAGAFPTWIAPTQVKIVTVAEKFGDYAKQVASALERNGVRVEVDNRNETIGKKIREAQLEKIPYTLIVGEKEVEANSVSVRKRKVGDIGSMSLKEFADKIDNEIKDKVID